MAQLPHQSKLPRLTLPNASDFLHSAFARGGDA